VKELVRVSEEWTADRLQISCEHIRPRTSQANAENGAQNTETHFLSLTRGRYYHTKLAVSHHLITTSTVVKFVFRLLKRLTL